MPKEQSVPMRVTFEVYLGAPHDHVFDADDIITNHLKYKLEIDDDEVYIESVEKVDWGAPS